MPDLTTTTEVWLPPEGQQLTPTDIGLQQTTLDNQIGQFLDALGGPNFLPAANFAAVVPTSGMGLQCGGAGQVAIAQGRILDSCPATNLTAVVGGSVDRIDLIAIKATRVAGSTTITRNVRADNATPQLYPMSGILAGGAATVNLPSGYTVAPMIIGPFPVGTDSTADLRVSSISTTQVAFQSDDSADTRAFSFLVAGNRAAGDPQGSLGVSSTISLYENRPAWQYVQNTSGTPLTPPSPPSGYDAYAQVYVHAHETSISSGDITYLFPLLPALSMNLILQALNVLGNTDLEGTLNVDGVATVASLIAGTAGKATITDDGTNALVESPGAVKLKSNIAGSAHTVTLDTSGNAQFPGNVAAGPAQKAILTDDGTNGYLQSPAAVKIQVNIGGTVYTAMLDTSGNFTVPQNLIAGPAGKIALTDDGTNAIVESAGAVKLQSNNAATTHTITLDTSGNTSFPGNIATGPSQKAVVTDDGTNAFLQSTGSVELKSNTGGTPHTAYLDTSGNFNLPSPGHYSGDGSGLTNIPNSALQNTPVNTISAGTGVSVTGSAPNPTVGLAHNDYVDLPNTQTISGAKTFSTAPVMSGANISNGTIPTAALAGVPIGGVIPKRTYINKSATSQTVTMNSALPTGNWDIYVRANFNIDGSPYTATLTGVDVGTSWGAAQMTADTDQPNNAELVLYGTAVGGNQPSVTLTTTGPDYVGYAGEFCILATRIG